MNHPAWQEYLNEVPEALQGVVKSAFEKWDTNVSQKIQQIHDSYAPLKVYQPLVDNNIPLDRVAKSLQFATELERDPKAMVSRMNEHFKLGLVSEDEVRQRNSAYSDLPPELDDISDHPQMKALMEAMKNLQERFDADDAEAQEEAEAEAFDQWLNTQLEGKPHLQNDQAKLLITNFMVSDIPFEQALAFVESNYKASATEQLNEQVNNNLNQQTNNGVEQSGSTPGDDLRAAVLASIGGQQTGSSQEQASNQAPAVVDNSGVAGTGQPQQQINFGSMSADTVDSLVIDVLKMNNNE